MPRQLHSWCEPQPPLAAAGTRGSLCGRGRRYSDHAQPALCRIAACLAIARLCEQSESSTSMSWFGEAAVIVPYTDTNVQGSAYSSWRRKRIGQGWLAAVKYPPATRNCSSSQQTVVMPCDECGVSPRPALSRCHLIMHTCARARTPTHIHTHTHTMAHAQTQCTYHTMAHTHIHVSAHTHTHTYTHTIKSNTCT